MSEENSDSRCRMEYFRKQTAMNMAREELSEQGFDSLVLMATYLDENGATVVIVANDCNWYAQNGMMQHVVDMRRESAAILTRSDSKGKK